MRLFIGTLYTVENEFEECVASIKKQTHQNYEHFVFKKLPNKEAHDTLYRTFMDRSDEFDLMIKVDADMVIEDEKLFAKIVKKFQANKKLKDLEIAVFDFFSNQLIRGMHAYRNTVKWQQNEEDLFVDSCPVGPGELIQDDTELAPAALHCKNPSPFQAFHYGVQKALKIVQPGRKRVNHIYTRYHWKNIERTRQNFLNTKDIRLGFAVLGAELAFMGGIHPKHISYSEPYLKNVFKEYSSLNTHQLEEKIRKISLKNFGFLPSNYRRKILVWVFRHKIFNRIYKK